ncbi:cysteine synthase [Hyphomonas sp. L-53-1-40]|uniref:cysteine synthase A n=1 Tax=Hyphomonas sp. L-53-1-40 TaxID=1207058 RepID=UPI000458C612|nr:cysteine synthase A [Hyphomonas sp. L-53-1-40]KCZ61890.1 cysteine synthase [Hyphomonas sp. L-53-1-40]
MSNTVSLPGNVSLDGPRGRTYASILETVGSTPLVAAPKFAEAEGIKANLLFKCEFFNPLASVKDRIGLNMVLQLEADGKLKPGGVLVEPTSGNTGIGLAFAAAMPESMSIERRKMLAYLGAELVLTPKEKGMGGAIAKAKEILEATPGAVMPSQFDNPANPAIHELTTAEEIWADTDGAVDAVLSGIGTGGTFTGTGRVLKARKPGLKMMAIEPEGSPVLSGGEPGPHMIQGIGAGFIPGNADTGLIDEVVKVSNEESFATARKLARLEGIPGGISSGAAAAAAAKVGARDDMADKTLVVILPSFAERYVSTALFEGL